MLLLVSVVIALALFLKFLRLLQVAKNIFDHKTHMSLSQNI